MNKLTCNGRPQWKAFTLIELLVVIAIIGALAGMLLAIIPSLNKNRTKAKATAELNEVATAIEAYKAKYGSYPPDNPNNVHINPLYFELTGTISTNAGRYTTLDGSCSIINPSAAMAALGVVGFANSAASLRGDDDRSGPVNFLKDVKPDRIGTNSGTRILVCSIGWDGPLDIVETNCSWCYNSSHPTNNPGSYDLWVDLFIQGKTNRFCNWSKQPYVP